MNGESQNKNEWCELYYDVSQRLSKAISNPAFLCSFIGVIIVLGSIGVWLPWLRDSKDELHLLRTEALLTYGISILASVSAEVLVGERRSKNFKMLLFTISIGAAFLLIFSYELNGAISSVIGIILVLFVWFVLNANDPKYDEVQSPESSIGGKDLVDINDLPGEGL